MAVYEADYVQFANARIPQATFKGGPFSQSSQGYNNIVPTDCQEGAQLFSDLTLRSLYLTRQG